MKIFIVLFMLSNPFQLQAFAAAGELIPLGGDSESSKWRNWVKLRTAVGERKSPFNLMIEESVDIAKRKVPAVGTIVDDLAENKITKDFAAEAILSIVEMIENAKNNPKAIAMFRVPNDAGISGYKDHIGRAGIYRMLISTLTNLVDFLQDEPTSSKPDVHCLGSIREEEEN